MASLKSHQWYNQAMLDLAHDPTLPQLDLLGFRWLKTSLLETRQLFLDHLSDGKDLWLVATPNPEQVMMAQRLPRFKADLEACDYLLPDGEGIIWASRQLATGHPLNQTQGLPERVSGTDVVAAMLAERSAQSELPVLAQLGPILLIGGRNYAGRTVSLGSQSWQLVAWQRGDSGAQWRPFQIYWWAGYQDAKKPTQAEEEAVREVLRGLRPRLVWVALGAPTQEAWAHRWRAELEAGGARLVMTVGGAFDMLTGLIPRAPRLWRQLRLEWGWRLLRQPHRWRRQLDLLRFLAFVWRARRASRST